MSKQPTCQAYNANGQPCGARPRKGRSFCAAHDPEFRREMDETRRLAGKRTMSRNSLRFAPESNFVGKTIPEVGDLLAETINQVRTGQIDIRVANAVGYLANILIRAREAAELEGRLERAEVLLEKMSSQFHQGAQLQEAKQGNPPAFFRGETAP